jgi:hypothetical protein
VNGTVVELVDTYRDFDEDVPRCLDCGAVGLAAAVSLVAQPLGWETNFVGSRFSVRVNYSSHVACIAPSQNDGSCLWSYWWRTLANATIRTVPNLLTVNGSNVTVGAVPNPWLQIVDVRRQLGNLSHWQLNVSVAGWFAGFGAQDYDDRFLVNGVECFLPYRQGSSSTVCVVQLSPPIPDSVRILFYSTEYSFLSALTVSVWAVEIAPPAPSPPPVTNDPALLWVRCVATTVDHHGIG